MTITTARVSRGIAWSGAAGVVMGVADVVGTLLLLRFWLTPEDYGIAALVTTLFPMLDLLADAGAGAAVIQSERLDDDRIASAKWLALIASGIVAAMLCVAGPVLAWVHDQPVLAGLAIAYAGKLLLQNTHWVHGALLRRELRFGAVAASRSAGALAELAGKLGAAAAGLGVWCFVVGQLAKTIAQAIAIRAALGKRPRGRFRSAHARELFRFGRRTMASQVIFHLYTNADYQIVGLLFGPAATGLYRAAYELVLEPAKLLSYMVVEVAFPVFSRLRDRRELADQLAAFTRHNVTVLAPVVAGLCLVPGDWLALAYGESWRVAADGARILCAVAALRSLSFLLPPLLDGIGRPELTLRYMIAAAVAVPATQIICGVALGDSLGWLAVAIGWAIGYPIAFGVLLAITLLQIEMRASRYARAALVPAIGVVIGALAALPVLRDVEATLPRIAIASGCVLVAHAGVVVITRLRAPRQS